ncbi:hypothetical protein E1287_16075 [Actinomadura sp. KC06]|nr:hypothetical protein E1287_16075 [Actinomadura sp. KC06]
MVAPVRQLRYSPELEKWLTLPYPLHQAKKEAEYASADSADRSASSQNLAGWTALRRHGSGWDPEGARPYTRRPLRALVGKSRGLTESSQLLLELACSIRSYLWSPFPSVRVIAAKVTSVEFPARRAKKCACRHFGGQVRGFPISIHEAQEPISPGMLRGPDHQVDNGSRLCEILSSLSPMEIVDGCLPCAPLQDRAMLALHTVET